MINWIVSFETFTMETSQVSRLRKNWKVCLQPIKLKKIMDQPIRAKQTSRQHHGVTLDDSRIAPWSSFRKRQSFLKNCQIFLGISATLTRITKAEVFLCFKKKNLNGSHKVKSHKVNKNTLKLSTKTCHMVECLQRVVSAAPQSKII